MLYQSGYVVDKPHAETGELAPDGNLNDEDLEHIHAVVDPGHHVDRATGAPYLTGQAHNGHTNQVFELGPDDGPDARVYAGVNEGLVLFRNELTRIYLAGPESGPDRRRTATRSSRRSRTTKKRSARLSPIQWTIIDLCDR